jgi:hypothetical protein
MQKFLTILLYFIPILVMIGLIPLVTNDYILTGLYVGFIIALLNIKREKNDLLALGLGVFGITISEYFFISTGVETFSRTSLLGVMPLWLPFLWGYAFITIKRALRVIDSVK